MSRVVLFLLLCVLGHASLSAQPVWPGDVNNNGVVNGVDLLYWGFAFGANGPARPTMSVAWAPQTPGAPWAQSFPTGPNYAFADCDGNGVVDEEDYNDAIDENFGLTQGTLLPDGFANARPGAGPRLRMVPSATLVPLGAMVDIDLFLDESETGPNDFYGLALKMSYTTGLLMDDDGPDFDFEENSWLEAGDDNAQELFVDGDGSGAAELAFTRTNQTSVPIEAGAIGQFRVIVEDIIVGLEVDTFVIQIDSVYLVGADFSTVATVPDTVRIIVARDTSKLTSSAGYLSPRQLEAGIQVYPNPTDAGFRLNTPFAVQQLTLTDALGRQWPLLPPHDRQWVPLPPDLPTGLYYLRLRTAQGDCQKKLIITR
ncbi:T9SS type A sorting domain-containing protein [Neolewinella lacunae]|uniref:T9SS type A sorting domain-containing protein n=1 Tax=Neolewinella lacunae TaxID=1517758 RepID=A0A923T7G0_9BACT|nr:T9SS type A sorting domain-containing protein [Neolewinella lacunae]MBC6993521.1 T9SS type A sorting domain-containing protein [Neolewinella lacunae]MDN3636203.1 T9SS type A sorting domain-containing protein [Neolewinella lacunae]